MEVDERHSPTGRLLSAEVLKTLRTGFQKCEDKKCLKIRPAYEFLPVKNTFKKVDPLPKNCIDHRFDRNFYDWKASRPGGLVIFQRAEEYIHRWRSDLRSIDIEVSEETLRGLREVARKHVSEEGTLKINLLFSGQDWTSPQHEPWTPPAVAREGSNSEYNPSRQNSLASPYISGPSFSAGQRARELHTPPAPNSADNILPSTSTRGTDGLQTPFPTPPPTSRPQSRTRETTDTDRHTSPTAADQTSQQVKLEGCLSEPSSQQDIPYVNRSSPIVRRGPIQIEVIDLDASPPPSLGHANTNHFAQEDIHPDFRAMVNAGRMDEILEMFKDAQGHDAQVKAAKALEDAEVAEAEDIQRQNAANIDREQRLKEAELKRKFETEKRESRHRAALAKGAGFNTYKRTKKAAALKRQRTIEGLPRRPEGWTLEQLRAAGKWVSEKKREEVRARRDAEDAELRRWQGVFD